MKASIIKKSLVCALTAALVMAPVMGVSAKTTDPASVTGNSVAATATSTTSTATAVASIPAVSSVGAVKSTVSGAFAVSKVTGVAFTTPLSDITAGYQLASGEKAYAIVWDLDPKKSNLAQAVIDNAAAALGAEVGPSLNLELGKKDAAGKYSLLAQDGAAVEIAIGVPANFAEAGKTLAVVRVRPGGAVSILPDLDSNPATVTFATTGGAGAYAIVKY